MRKSFTVYAEWWDDADDLTVLRFPDRGDATEREEPDRGIEVTDPRDGSTLAVLMLADDGSLSGIEILQSARLLKKILPER